jgi:ankyrin repeat protein
MIGRSSSTFTSNLLDAVAFGDFETVNFILSKTNHNFDNHLDEKGNNVLHYCASLEAEGLAPVLICQYNASSVINKLNKNKESPLHFHCKFGCKVGVACLLYHGAIVDIVSTDGITPMEYALKLDDDEIANMMRSYGAKKIQVNNDRMLA